MTTLAVVVMLGSAAALVAVWISQLRHPDRWSRFLAESFWRRCVGRTLTLAIAAVLGVAGGGGTLLVPVLAIAASCLLLAGTMWINAR